MGRRKNSRPMKINNTYKLRIPSQSVLAVRSERNRKIIGYSNIPSGYLPSDLSSSESSNQSSQNRDSSNHNSNQRSQIRVPKRINSKTQPDLTSKQKKKYSHHPGTMALKEIRRLQKTTNLLVPKASFKRLLREVLSEKHPEYRIQASAVEALHHATEAYVIDLFEDSNLCAIHAKRVTVMSNDLQLVKKIKKH